MKRSIATEAQEQAALFRWAAFASGTHPELRLLFHVPNGGSRDPIEARHLKEQGVKAGVPDMFLPVPRGGYHGLFIELKRSKGGVVSEDQRAWLDRLRLQGYRAEVARGWDAAREIIEEYLKED